MNNEDVDGSVKVKEWQLMNDPFSQAGAKVSANKAAKRRAADQIESIEQEVMQMLDAQTARSKLHEQRRRERTYGNTRKYAEDPRKKREKEKVRSDRPPPGSSFSFR